MMIRFNILSRVGIGFISRKVPFLRFICFFFCVVYLHSINRGTLGLRDLYRKQYSAGKLSVDEASASRGSGRLGTVQERKNKMWSVPQAIQSGETEWRRGERVPRQRAPRHYAGAKNKT